MSSPVKQSMAALTQIKAKGAADTKTEPSAPPYQCTTETPLTLFGEDLASITLLSIFLLSGSTFRNTIGRGVERPIVAAKH